MYIIVTNNIVEISYGKKGVPYIHRMNKASWKTAVFNVKKIRKSETLQLILLDNLYAQSGSQDIIFQGGTALRWVYGGMRFSEDLDFVTSLPAEDIDKILTKTLKKMESACIAQFGT
jgi:predicted nucleotidyltransferase component of viral defense system